MECYGFTLLVLLAVHSVVGGQDDGQRPCVSLPDCEPLLQMVKNKDNIPGMTRQDVFKIVHSEMCGFEDNTPKVFCNVEEEVESTGDEIVARHGVIDVIGDVDERCRGALKLLHFNNRGADAKSLILKGGFYSNIRRLSDRTVFLSEVNGNCCWTISEHPYLSGQRQDLLLGHTYPPRVQPRAAKKTECTTIEDTMQRPF